MNVLLQLLPLLLFPSSVSGNLSVDLKPQVAIEHKVVVFTISDSVTVVAIPPDVHVLAQQVTARFFGDAEWPAMDSLIRMESGYQNIWNKNGSGACGLAQALPCSKLPQGINTPLDKQVEWMCTYIRNRYGTPSNALAFHRANGWY